jgi:hypothetical protein
VWMLWFVYLCWECAHGYGLHRIRWMRGKRLLAVIHDLSNTNRGIYTTYAYKAFALSCLMIFGPEATNERQLMSPALPT